MGVLMASSLPSLLLCWICSRLQVLDFGLLNDELPSLLLVIGQCGQQLDILSSNEPSSRLAASTDWRCQLLIFQIYYKLQIGSAYELWMDEVLWTNFTWCTGDRLLLFIYPVGSQEYGEVFMLLLFPKNAVEISNWNIIIIPGFSSDKTFSVFLSPSVGQLFLSELPSYLL